MRGGPGRIAHVETVRRCFFSSRRRHTRFDCDWSSDVCSSDLFSGTAQAFQASQQGLVFLLLLAVVVIYIVLGILYESFVHPLTILSGLPFAGFGARSEERRVGEECRSRWVAVHLKKKSRADDV